MKGFFNIMDGNYWVQTSEGLTVGIGETEAEAIEEAEFLGFDCANIEWEE